MTPTVLIALASLALALFAQAAAVFIWGGSISQRVKALEDDMKALKELPMQVARLEVRIDAIFETLRDLSASVRWMREPAPPYQPQPLRRPVTDKDEGR